jgi:hypothetical protein
MYRSQLPIILCPGRLFLPLIGILYVFQFVHERDYKCPRALYILWNQFLLRFPSLNIHRLGESMIEGLACMLLSLVPGYYSFSSGCDLQPSSVV